MTPRTGRALRPIALALCAATGLACTSTVTISPAHLPRLAHDTALGEASVRELDSDRVVVVRRPFDAILFPKDDRGGVAQPSMPPAPRPFVERVVVRDPFVVALHGDVLEIDGGTTRFVQPLAAVRAIDIQYANPAKARAIGLTAVLGGAIVLTSAIVLAVIEARASQQ